MAGLSDIPEPTTAYRPETEPPPPQAPLPTSLPATGTAAVSANHTHNKTEDEEEPQQRIDSVSCLLLLLIAGGLLRAVLGLLGPLQGLDTTRFTQLSEQGDALFAGQPVDAFPLFALLAMFLSMIGLPAWVAAAIGSLFTLAAVPAAYVAGRATTGRRAVGILAAAMIAVHPGVLTSANTLSATALALALVTVGLALSCHAAKRGMPFAIGGGVTLCLAGFAAPLCWILAALAGPFVGHLTLHRGHGRALLYATTVFVLAVAPVFAFRAIYFGTSPDALLSEFNTNEQASPHAPTDRMLITLTDPSLAELGTVLNLPVSEAGKLTVNTVGAPGNPYRDADLVADLLADSWLLMNTAIAGLAAVSVGVMLIRRRLIEVLVLTTPLIVMAWSNLPPGETLRLPMLTLLAVLSAGLLANRPISEVDEAAREAKRIAKQAMKDEKERARQERERDKRKRDLFAFDKTKKASASKTAEQPAAHDVDAPVGVLTARVSDDGSVPMRPI